jgi:hypothetical protein
VKLYRITPNLGENLVLRCSRSERSMELAGIEPAASGLQNRRSPN